MHRILPDRSVTTTQFGLESLTSQSNQMYWSRRRQYGLQFSVLFFSKEEGATPSSHPSYRVHANDNHIPGECQMLKNQFLLLTRYRYNTSLTNNPAIPIPVPRHILVNSIFFFCRLHSLNPHTICLTPVHPNGWPKAIAPPLGFIFAQSSCK
jgi:hypothetical protein